MTILGVRHVSEWATGHIEETIHTPSGNCHLIGGISAWKEAGYSVAGST